MSLTVGQPQEAILRDILRTVAFFTLRGQAVTPTDCWRWLYCPTLSWTLGEVIVAVRYACERSLLSLENGRVVLVGEEAVFATQQTQFSDANIKWRIARRVAWWAALIPGVRLVAVGNTLAWEATRSESDIDLFVITRSGCVWFVRFLCVVPLMIRRARPGVRRQHPIDFTFFVDQTRLDLSRLRIHPDDPYLAYWLTSLVPLVDDGVFAEFWEANAWARETLPNATPVRVAWYRRVKNGQAMGQWVYWIVQITGLMSIMNGLAKRLSERRFPEAIRTKMNHSTDVVVNDTMLKFHVADQRRQIVNAWNQRCQSYELLP
ncbi:hypothetical protein COV06_04285 [Candidatus Uhrbacteria bacterium CG10_big_fil_rev_8_21_14_0_10_50_16]|uniref:Polymerase nucleotidyl transferase domain-containing protein n=1 Tax=Candidatus Uhrbacteria bacterium CG10_big_fil_rev_8_21_14_0_10_50_16 TaxID=1975039 RepID=A0A2H0RL97_9BACT|nr:MAG: hypothetical protein COV06_04285 [Candidatus Uhrbacteria bacterium CG10_big_fil_rev_8_21_14_0_10_50_16]